MKVDWPYTTPGIPDKLFVRDKTPLTKEEIRVLTLAKARLSEGQVVWDIGSGTGSLAIEVARLIGKGTVYAVEQDRETAEIIRENIRRFGLENIKVVVGRAPEVLVDLPIPQRVLIGGSGGLLSDIITLLEEKIPCGGRVVINAVTLETLVSALTALGPPWQREIIQVSVARSTPCGRYQLMQALNPVWIIAAQKGGKGDAG